MKKLLFVLMIMIPVLISAQDTTSNPTSTSVEVIDHLYDKTTEAIQDLAQALKVPAEHVYNLLVKQQVINSITSLIVIIISIIIGILLVTVPLKDWRRQNELYLKERYPESRGTRRDYHYDLDDDWWVISLAIGVAMLVVVVIASICAANSIVTGFLNPEYGAIKEIMSIL